MAEEAKKVSFTRKISNFIQGVKSEYSKIIFPAADTVKKQTVSVIIVSVIIAVLIFLIDLLLKYLLGFVL